MADLLRLSGGRLRLRETHGHFCVRGSSAAQWRVFTKFAPLIRSLCAKWCGRRFRGPRASKALSTGITVPRQNVVRFGCGLVVAASEMSKDACPPFFSAHLIFR